MLKRAREIVKHWKWYHICGGIATMSVLQVSTLWVLSKSYHWFFAAEEEKQRRFLERYGRPTEAQRQEAYSWMAPDYDQGVGLLESGVADKFRQEVFQGASGEVLEVAVGTGRCFSVLDAAEVTKYVGVDVNEAMLTEVRKKLPERPFKAEVVRASGERLPFEDGSFDTVIGSLCLCALENPAKGLEEMVRVCKPQGKVLLLETGVAYLTVARWGQRHLGLVPNPTHEWEFGYRDDLDILELLEACSGLVVDQVRARGMGNWYLIWARSE
ncbi:unnamed protein product [Effrenium voratum]|uniref:Methyltransferase type 11 domain-containing protein n=1 Tax=Effrenium voratum TaxID=2562239 RepID=A0AA36MNJ2_9DINO|nr:unnamed protein product [Effrenium voratum]CAJ1373637.1 unnamed protein product [Effrenium voratum]CAJ1459765.1 unnamed protein product [Effrenium voratum]